MDARTRLSFTYKTQPSIARRHLTAHGAGLHGASLPTESSVSLMLLLIPYVCQLATGAAVNGTIPGRCAKRIYIRHYFSTNRCFSDRHFYFQLLSRADVQQMIWSGLACTKLWASRYFIIGS